MSQSTTRESLKQSIVLLAVAIGIGAALYFIAKHAGFTDLLYLRELIESQGAYAPIIFILIMAVAIVISPIPSLPLTISSGFIWGPVLGTVYSVTGAMIGAIISFLIARKFGREVIQRLLKQDIDFCDMCAGKSMFWIVLISRVFPFFQFDIVSYGAGLTNMRLRSFAIATLIGMIPTTYLFIRFGYLLSTPSWIGITISLVLILGIFLVPVFIKHKIFKHKQKQSNH